MKKKKNKIRVTAFLLITIFIMGACSNDKTEWQKAKKLSSITVLEDFIEQYPESAFQDSAKNLIEELYFQKCQLINTDSAYRSFMNKFPESELGDSVNYLIEKINFQLAKSENTILSYTSFIDKFPGNIFIDSAYHEVEKLDFQEALKKNSIDSFSKFKNSHPQSVYLDTIDVIVEELHFKKAIKLNSPDSYLAFIKSYPNSSLLNKARFEKEEICIIQFNKDYTKLSESIISNSSKNNYLKIELKHPPNAEINLGNGMIGKAGPGGITLAKEFPESEAQKISTEYVEFAPYIAIFIDKSTVLIGGKNGAKFNRLPNNKIQISKGTLYKFTMN